MDPSTLLPHRYPFLLVDRIDAVDPGKSAHGTKRVTGSEWAIVGTRGHGGLRVMPHLLIVEALAQLSGAVLAGLLDGSEGAIGYFLGINNAHFRGAASPGDVLSLAVELRSFRRGICRTHAVAQVGARRIVRADLTSVLRPIERATTGPSA
jgi:3-hydroxyacyl-[acyl-carrier-protein] dehydratase